ncbi:MAG: metal-dependent hydrolase [Aeriscardovia sp.]|nr:metal-dependent hydrolase [Aeriscardovia sp.]
MMGRNHVIAGESTFVALAPLLTWADVHASAGHPGSHGFFSWLEANSYGLLCHDWVTFLLGLFAYTVGCLFPDIDQPHSLITRLTHVSLHRFMAHRTWTHAVWIPASLFVFALCLEHVPYLRVLVVWFALGMLDHDFVDSLSDGGICWFWPISSYRYTGPNTKVKAHGHFLKLYHVKHASEMITLGAFVVAAISGALWCLVGGEPFCL